MPPLSDTRLRPLILGLVVLLLLLSSFATGVSTNRFANATDVFVSDDPDPTIGALPPFIQPDLRTILQSPNISAANASRARDFTYSTSQPSHEVGPHNQTLAEYRHTNLQNLPHNRSTSVWFPDSNRSNGTVVTNAHVTILGTQNGTQTRLGRTNTSSQNLFLLPRNGSILASLDYSTAIPNQTCTVTNGTKTCLNYSITSQSINRSLRIGSQTWASEKYFTGSRSIAAAHIHERTGDWTNDNGRERNDHNTAGHSQDRLNPDEFGVGANECDLKYHSPFAYCSRCSTRRDHTEPATQRDTNTRH